MVITDVININTPVGPIILRTLVRTLVMMTNFNSKR